MILQDNVTPDELGPITDVSWVVSAYFTVLNKLPNFTRAAAKAVSSLQNLSRVFLE